MTYKITFEKNEIYHTNLVNAESISDVEKHYNKYTVLEIREARDFEIKEAERNHMPVVTIEPEPEPEPEPESTAAIKKLLSTSKNALRNLHDTLGLDFCQSYKAFEISGRFTVRGIEKKAAALVKDYSPETYSTVVLSKRENRFQCGQYMLATIEPEHKVDTEYKIVDHGYYKLNLDGFYNKGYFDETRKDETTHTIVIVQRREYLTRAEPLRTYPNPETLEENIRYKIFEYKPGSHLYFAPVESDGKRRYKSLRTYYVAKKGTKEDDLAFDKSGYYVFPKRYRLRKEAARIRAEKQKAAADARDYSGSLKTLENKLFEIKSSIAKRLDAAGTLEEVKEVSEMMIKWRGLPDVWQDYIFLRDRAANKGFSSPAVFDSRYADITAALEKINNKLNEKR